MQNDFDKALEGLLHVNFDDLNSEKAFGELFRDLITSSMKICAETDFNASVENKIKEAEIKYNSKIDLGDETDPYKRMRGAVRFSMLHEAKSCGKEYEICCTEKNLESAMKIIRKDLEKAVPANQLQVIDSMGHSLVSDFADFFVSRTLDMVADIKIYGMKEFRPLQLNAMGKEIRTYANIVSQQNAQPQKSETVSNWFRTLFVLPALLFRKLYAVSMTEMFGKCDNQIQSAKRMFAILDSAMENFSNGDEYKIMKQFLTELGLGDSLTIRPASKKQENKPLVN